MNATISLAKHIKKMNYNAEFIAFRVLEGSIFVCLSYDEASFCVGTFPSDEEAYEWLSNGRKSSKTIKASLDFFYARPNLNGLVELAVYTSLNAQEGLSEADYKTLNTYFDIFTGATIMPLMESHRALLAMTKDLLELYISTGANYDAVCKDIKKQRVFHSDLVKLKAIFSRNPDFDYSR